MWQQIIRPAKATPRNTRSGQYRAEPSHQALRLEMRAFANRLKNNKAEARKFLVEAGIVAPKGNLRKAYGGKATNP